MWLRNSCYLYCVTPSTGRDRSCRHLWTSWCSLLEVRTRSAVVTHSLLFYGSLFSRRHDVYGAVPFTQLLLLSVGLCISSLALILSWSDSVSQMNTSSWTRFFSGRIVFSLVIRWETPDHWSEQDNHDLHLPLANSYHNINKKRVGFVDTAGSLNTWLQ